MNLPLKFKAICSDTHKWVFGYGVVYADSENAYIIHKQGINAMQHTMVIPETVCMFTGRISKCGKDLYTSDLVSVKGRPRVGIYNTLVIWDRFGFTLESNKTQITDQAAILRVLEIKGNIHDKYLTL